MLSDLFRRSWDPVSKQELHHVLSKMLFAQSVDIFTAVWQLWEWQVKVQYVQLDLLLHHPHEVMSSWPTPLQEPKS